MRSRLPLWALVALVSLTLNACAAGSFPDLWKKSKFDEEFTKEFCGVFGFVMYTAGFDFFEGLGATAACLERYTEQQQVADARAASVLPRAAASNRAWQAGELLMSIYLAQGKVKASQFPPIVMGLPVGSPSRDIQDIRVGLMLAHVEQGRPKQVFSALEVELREPGASDAIAEGRDEFSTGDPFGEVLFEGVPTDRPLEIEVEVAGGAIRDSMVVLSVGRRAATEEVAALGWAGPRLDSLGHLGSMVPLPPARPGSRMTKAAQNVAEVTEMGMVFVFADGKVKSGKVPKMALDLAADGRGRVDVSAGVSIADSEFEPPKSKYLPKTVTAELLAVDRNGKTTRLAKATTKVDAEGTAGVDFEGVQVPTNAGLRVVLAISGKRVRNALVVGTASVQ